MKKTVSRKDYINLLANSPFTKKVFDGLYNEPIKPRVLSDYEEAVIAWFKGNKDRYNKIYWVEDIKTEVKEVKSSYVDDTSKIKEIKSAVDWIYDSIKKELWVFRNNDSTLFLETKVIKKDLNSQKELNNKRINDTNEKIEKVKAKIAEDITNASNSLKNDIDSLSAFSNTALDKIDSLTTSFANENIKLSDKFTNLLNGKSDATHTHKVDEIQWLDINVFHTKEEAKKLEKKLSDFYTKKEIKDKLMSIANSSGRWDSNVARWWDTWQVLIKRSPIDYDTYRGTAWGGGTRWSITWTLSDQTDLQSALDAKFTLPSLTSGSILFSDGSTISQDNSSLFFDDTDNRLWLLTTAPTHTVTMGSTGTGIALYNTADQTTNYERVRMQWVSNRFDITVGTWGSWSYRSIRIWANSWLDTSWGVTNITVEPNNLRYAIRSWSSASLWHVFTVWANTASSWTHNILSISWTLNHSWTAWYTALLINPTETTTGSGLKLLQDRQVWWSSKAVMTNAGSFGIGVTAPTTKIQVYAGSWDGISVLRSDVTAQRINIYPNDNTVSCLITWWGNNKPFYIASVWAQSLHFGTNYSSALNEVKMTIDSTWRVIYWTNSSNYISASSDNATATSGGVTMLYSGHATSTNNVFSHSFISSTRSWTTGTIGMVKLTQTWTPSWASSANYNWINLGYTINATAWAGSWTATWIFVNATETSLNWITHNLIDLQVASSSKFKVTNAWAVTATNITTRIVPRVTTITSSATPTINTDNCDAVTITALATDITSMTTNLTGTPNNFDKLTFRIKDDWTARAITRWASFENMGGTLPTATTISKVHTIELIYNTVTSKRWCIMSVVEA